MSKLNELDRIYNLIVCSRKLKSYIAGYTEAQLEKDPKTIDAICYVLIQFAINFKSISNQTRRKYDKFPNHFDMIAFDRGFCKDDIWSILYEEEYGLIELVHKFNTMYKLEQEEETQIIKEKKRVLFLSKLQIQKEKQEEKRISNLLLEDKHAIRTKNSVTVVKNKLTRS